MIGDPTKAREYKKHLRSGRWRRLRQSALSRSGGKCERCGEETRWLDCHHLNYDRFGHERLEDLAVLCVPCHIIADREREQAMTEAADFTRYANAYRTYVFKKYGYCDESWRHEKEFEGWLDRRENA